MSDPANYTVGWICALQVEYVAAQVFLDEEHERPSFVSPNDTNEYALGKISGHNVVIAVLPDGEYGTASVANVATNMLNTFHNVRIGLMVGIGGGVPSESHDIRLGDVVVSAPRGGEGGVFQYDFGKSIQGQKFLYTRFLNQPPAALRAAITGIQAQYERKGHRLEEAINSIFDKNARLRQKYGRPEPVTDRLFKAEVTHSPKGCAEACASDPSNLILRHERNEYEDNPVIHYGLIASANQLMKDAVIRDRLSAEKDVLCFEMEAAGLMNTFPCLVIRGICDYSDSHKNKKWQGYAAMAAAAYAKDLLRRIPPNKIEAEKRIGDILSGLQYLAEAHRTIAHKQLHIQENIVKQKWSTKQEQCLQLFRLTSGTKDATYEWYKDHVEARVEGTCEWFLNHKNFQRWLEEYSGPLLVSADPGCGKSVLAKYLIDERLPRSTTICYFFFKDQDQNTVRQALCAVLHQLFSQKGSLIKYAMDEMANNGPGLINSTNTLWTILGKAVRDPQAGPIIIVLDALDECAESEFEDLIRCIESQFRSHHSCNGKLKYLLTSRPYEQIMCKFMGLLESFPYVRIPGEEESEGISREVNYVIQYRVEQLAKERRLSDLVKLHLAKRLLEIPHRTYLWVYLVFDYLTTAHFKKTPNGVDSAISTLPTNINEAYERILDKSKKDPMVRRALSMILAASRPLTLSEMNIALNVDSTSKSILDLDLEEDEDFRSRLRTSCGLFVSIHQDKIYFLHQTAREFLLAQAKSPSTVPSESRWQHSISLLEAHNTLAEVCVIYLDFLNNDIIPTEVGGESRPNLDRHIFLDYSAKNWGTHYLKACISADADILSSTLSICTPDSRSWSAWFTIFWETTHYSFTENFTNLMISSYFGLEAVVTVLLERGADSKSKDKNYGRTPLSWAALNGHKTTVKLLLDKNADFQSTDNSGQTPLSFAAEKGHEDIVKLLLEKGADFDSKDNDGRTALSRAAQNGREGVVKLLLEKDADVQSKDKECGQTSLSWAAQNGNESVVKLLLEKDAHIESKDSDGLTPISLAAGLGHDAIVKILLDYGADFESKNDYGTMPLSFAAGGGHEITVKLLLEKGANFESRNNLNQTPLSWAAGNGQETVVKLLLEKGANFESKDNFGRTPISFVAENGHDGIVNLLLEKGADFESKDEEHGRTPLSWATLNGHETIFKLLLEKGADFESKDNYGQTPLLWAALNGHETIFKLLLEKGADFESKDEEHGRTPLSWAALNGHETIFKLLLEKGADFQSKDNYGQTPLLWAALNGHETIFKLLLEKGADFESKDNYGRKPLSVAARNGHEAIFKLLLEKGADFESRDEEHGRTPLSWASLNGHETIFKLLLEKGADFQSKDNYGQTPLLLAALNGHEANFKLLLEKGADFESKDNYGRKPLSVAARNGHEAILKLLLERSADFESSGEEYSRTPLSWAVLNGHETIFKLLLEKGADFESKDNFGRTPMSWAAENGHEKIFKLLLEKGADFESKNNYGRTPLSWAALNGHEAIVKLLLEKGADFESKDKYSHTPLSWAALKGHEVIVELLLQRGANFESKDNFGLTPLSFTAKNGHEAIVKLLLEEGADFNSKDNFGRTPLSWAALNGHETTVKLLLDKSADFESKDNCGRKPLSVAAGNGHEAIVKLLLERGADFESKDINSRTPLLWAIKTGHQAVVNLLLERGADATQKSPFFDKESIVPRRQPV